jgi:hypothetical protein
MNVIAWGKQRETPGSGTILPQASNSQLCSVQERLLVFQLSEIFLARIRYIFQNETKPKIPRRSCEIKVVIHTI